MELTEKYAEFVDRIRPAVLGDSSVMAGLFDSTQDQDAEMQEHSLDILLDEGRETVIMIQQYLRPGVRLLEVGGGIGLTYAFLRSEGYAITSLEPSTGGFGDRYRSGERVIQLAGIETDDWLPIICSRVDETDKQFDVIFSHFVLEHVADLEESFEAMEAVLAERGQMIHRCPNYSVPFEPHYNLPLVPGAPRLTQWIFRRLKGDPLWEELQFTTIGSIRRVCRKYGLKPMFEVGMYRWAFERILSDPTFKSRKGAFGWIASLLSTLGLLKLVGYLPATLTTPMTFTARRLADEC